MTPTQKHTQEELDEISGFGRPNIAKWPSIKFAANDKGKGKCKSFTLIKVDENDEPTYTDLGEELNVVFLHRGAMKLKSSDYVSREVSHISQPVKIFNKEGFSLADEGDYKEMKEKYKMSTMQYPFVLLNGEVVKLGITPSSLGNFYNYLKEFKGKERPYHYWTAVKADPKEKKTKGGTYYVMDFLLGDDLSEEEQKNAINSLIELNEKLKQNKEARAKYDNKPQEEAPEDVTEPEPKEEETKEEVDVKNIPF